MAFRAEAKDYTEFHAAFRLRAEQLQVSRLALDELGGTAHGWFGKFLGPRQIRRIGFVTLGPALAALGLKIVIVEDEEALEKIKSRSVKRAEHCVRHRECNGRHDHNTAA
jgi:hypothetical protein